LALFTRVLNVTKRKYNVGKARNFNPTFQNFVRFVHNIKQ